MGVTAPANRRRDALIRMPLGEIADWHLAATCSACRQDRIVSIRSLVEHYGPHVTLLPLIPRFRCGVLHCRRPPTVLRLRNRMPPHPGPPMVDVVLLDRRAAGP